MKMISTQYLFCHYIEIIIKSESELEPLERHIRSLKPIVFRPFCCSIDDVKGICVTRFVREIFFGHVNDFTVEEHQTPCHNIQTRLHSVIQNKHTHTIHTTSESTKKTNCGCLFCVPASHSMGTNCSLGHIS
jgi:hypothetical protein